MPKQVRLYEKVWEIEKNDLGVPLHRIRRGLLAATVKDQKYCFLVEADFKQVYTGGGKYASNVTTDWRPEGAVGACP